MNMDYSSVFAFLFDFHHLLFLGIGLASGYGIGRRQERRYIGRTLEALDGAES